MRPLILVLVALSFFTAYSVYAGEDPDADYDRLDGTGASHEKVQVIEWEGNLEVHVYPKGTLQGLGLKLDKRNKDKPVMVLAYRFGGKPLVRRAILGIDLKENFKTFKDPTEDEFDKIIISNDPRPEPEIAFRLDPTPTQLYPDGYADALAKSKAQPATTTRMPAQANMKSAATTASASTASNDSNDDGVDSSSDGADGDGGINPFFMRTDAAGGGGRGGR